jgi:NAD(P)-dependent dehydrogenase (short-subunit alcohol dehydrogenase family)
MLSDDAWGLEDMPDQSGRTVVVTGANSGLGYAATKAFAAHGAHVVMACRSLERGRSAREDIETTLDDPHLSLIELDLASLESVQTFVDRFLEEYDHLHVLCNNAGVMGIPRQETADGFEKQFGVNHLGHFALTGLLLETIEATDGETRIVTQSSGMHQRGTIDFEDLHGEASYDRWGAYARSKLANLLFAFELDRRLTAADASSLSLGCHPGYAATNLQRRGPEQAGSRIRLWTMQAANALLAQSPERGALPMVYAATAPGLTGGEYIGPGGFMNMRGSPEIQEPSERARDEDAARRLWQVSEDLTGVSYDLPVPQ